MQGNSKEKSQRSLHRSRKRVGCWLGSPTHFLRPPKTLGGLRTPGRAGAGWGPTLEGPGRRERRQTPRLGNGPSAGGEGRNWGCGNCRLLAAGRAPLAASSRPPRPRTHQLQQFESPEPREPAQGEVGGEAAPGASARARVRLGGGSVDLPVLHRPEPGNTRPRLVPPTPLTRRARPSLPGPPPHFRQTPPRPRPLPRGLTSLLVKILGKSGKHEQQVQTSWGPQTSRLPLEWLLWPG